MSDTHTFVLVHGGCHDGSAWRPIVRHLEQLGHTAFAPTVAGHGKNVPKNVTHAQSTQSVVNFILDKNLTDFVLVGHGYAGTIISKVAEAVPERIRRLVFWSAFVLYSGETALELLPGRGVGGHEKMPTGGHGNAHSRPISSAHRRTRKCPQAAMNLPRPT
ncbi:alpha/beta fold hydrolase [Mycobacterium terramassiliense]|uniref:alpha/beta fold hydrolase n=1 Tax=Mycobacterium terramassiliense TaxID=1841859 RepID=UPI00097DB080|nr:alpha/beta fold hydrolase [Mycobacterium terramassiliense]